MKRMLEILVPATCGVVLTVGVAWGVAAFGDVHRFTGQYRGTLAETRIPGYLGRVLPPPREVIHMPGWQWGYDVRGTECELAGASSLPAGWFTVWSSEYGWPCRAMASCKLDFRPQYDQGSEDAIRRVFDSYEARGEWASGVPMSEAPPAGPGRRRLPLELLWPGFAVNTAITGGLAWCVLFGPGRIKRFRRARRGVCVACGYDLRGLHTCPECGRPAAVRAGSQPPGSQPR